MKHQIQLTVNGEPYDVAVEPRTTLVELLREKLELTGTKEGCNSGVCGACTVLLDGKAIKSCLMLAVKANGKNIITIEGLAKGSNLHPLQESFIQHGAIQCGFCTPGMILTSKALLDENPNPSEDEVRNYLVGNLCRCTGYVKIIEAVIKSSKKYSAISSQ